MEFIPPNKRFRLFFDETGNGDLHAADKSPNERYLSITGIVLRQDIHDNYVSKRLAALKADIFGHSETSPVILHRREIVRREGPFSVLKSAHARQEFDARLGAIISECITCAFTTSIDKLAHKQKYAVWQYSPYHYVMECLTERFVMWLERHDCVGDVIGEARNKTHDQKLRNAYRSLHNRGNTYLTADRFQRRLISSEIRLLPKDADVAGLQLADVLAHPAHRALKFAQLKETPPDDFGTFLAKILDRKVYDRNGKGRVVGFGTKWLPK